MRCILPGVLLSIAAAGTASAGAWPRGDGRSFLSLEGTITAPRDQAFSNICDGPPLPGETGIETIFLPDGTIQTLPRTCPADGPGGLLEFLGFPELGLSAYDALFYEYGIDENLTLGLDVGFEVVDDSWTALGFVRRSFKTDGPNVWAIELAAGPSRGWDGARGTIIRPGLFWGRGTSWGWLSAESYLVHGTLLNGTAYKLDLTAGWNWSDTSSWILQVQNAAYPGSDPTVRLAPSYVRSLRDNIRVKLGAVADVASGEDVGVSTALWIEF